MWKIRSHQAQRGEEGASKPVRAAAPRFDLLSDPGAGWRALGFIDTLSHASRLTLPVLLTVGSDDLVTPPDTIESLFKRLPGTRSFTRLHGTGHDCTPAYMHLAAAWFAFTLDRKPEGSSDANNFMNKKGLSSLIVETVTQNQSGAEYERNVIGRLQGVVVVYLPAINVKESADWYEKYLGYQVT